MDAIRKQLDQLMGANRNGDVREVSRKYYDRDVCRLFLAGLCPHDLFQLTKMDMGPCPKLHSLQLRKEYEEAKAKGMDNYDRELEETIERLIVECERKIQRALKRLEEEDAKAAIAISITEVTQSREVLEFSKQIKEKMKEIDTFDFDGNTEGKIRATEEVDKLKEQRAEEQAKLLLEAFNKDRVLLVNSLQTATQSTAHAAPDARTQEMINEKLKKAEELGESGMIDEAQKLLDEAEALKKLGARPQPVPDSAKMSTHVQITDQKLRLCDICGAFLSVYDSDRRLADHFGGKLHMGYMLIREKLSELQEEKNKRRKVDRTEHDRRSKERSTEHDRASSRDRHRGDRSSSRDRHRDYDRRSSHDRYHDRESRYDHDKESGRSRSYDSRSRRRSRSPRDSSRDYDRHGRRDR
ncbi:protein LUC7-like isoform X1 [Triticum urartu]|uniref:RNA-binding protein Luc7-like 2 n=1 Tax=Triticum urartu TaxID=4572 RepID=A0A8R7QRA1_TRIUA|nr:protein LUC7-like isoform X1 [Triticum urartu]